jgi:hypothetical protein
VTAMNAHWYLPELAAQRRHRLESEARRWRLTRRSRRTHHAQPAPTAQPIPLQRTTTPRTSLPKAA